MNALIYYFLALALFVAGGLFGLVAMYFLRVEIEDEAYVEGFEEGMYVERRHRITGEDVIRYQTLQSVRNQVPR